MCARACHWDVCACKRVCVCVCVYADCVVRASGVIARCGRLVTDDNRRLKHRQSDEQKAPSPFAPQSCLWSVSSRALPLCDPLLIARLVWSLLLFTTHTWHTPTHTSASTRAPLQATLVFVFFDAPQIHHQTHTRTHTCSCTRRIPTHNTHVSVHTHTRVPLCSVVPL